MNKPTKLKKISTVIGSGITPSRTNMSYWENGVIPWLKTEQLGEHEIYDTKEKITQAALNETSIKVFPKNTLSIAMYGEGKTRGNVSILKRPMTTNQACCNIVIDEKKADYEFVYYFLKTQYLQLRSLSSGVRKNLNSSDIKEFEVNLPEEIKTQRQIASVLSSIDSKIALNNLINSELEAMAKTVYDYWFVQFEFPFDFAQGKPSAKGKPYKSNGGKMVWCEELKRETPEGWEVGELKDITNFTTGKLDSNAEVINAKYPFYTCAAEPTTTDTYAYDDTVILIAGNNASGNFHINRYKGKFNAYQRTYIITAKELIDLEYIYQVLNIETKLLKTQGKGSQTKFLTIGMLTGIKVINDKGLMNIFHKIVNPMYEKQEVLRKENQQLSSLRDWLLPMLMNGQVSAGAQPLASVGRQTSSEVERLMAAEPGVEYLSTGKNNSTTSFKQWTIGERTILAAYLIKKFNGKGFGRVMLMKLLFLVEYMCELDFDSQYKVNVAGPYDDLIREIELKLRTHKLYDAKQNKFDNHVTYEEMGGTTNVESLYYENFSQEVSPINSILEKFKNSHWDQCEIIATMYAVWNNRLIKGSPINDMALKQDFLNWDPNKEKYKDRLDSALTWMRSYEVVPKGWGKVIDK
jgi:type I restriction enzyme S subunit